ncbi:prevent-host-death family protein [Streptomyces abikoensis]
MPMPQEFADHEDELALALHRARRAAGAAVAVPHEEVPVRLGPDPADSRERPGPGA